jgi:hypothetical protein
MCMMVIHPSTYFFLMIITVTIPALQTVDYIVVGSDVQCMEDALVLITVIGDDVQCTDALVMMTVI